ncbi:hypothetical protein QR680_012437 [Steinernema hermaphroditum]|uniref:RNase NYN domain-containing protein n=1 Tax=Steinernema hermaphroditum TaxID=289476 RepID=A0AA39M0I1_9BILA|nr:hypothetical protein QR680_012437 [Steinernema hermaphroditum]
MTDAENPRVVSKSSDPMRTKFDPDRSVRRLAVIDVMNFLHNSASKNAPHLRNAEDTRNYLDALDLASFMSMFLQRGFDVRAVVPRSARYRARNGFLFDLFFAMGLIVYTEKCYDDLVIIKYAAARGGFIVSCDKYRDCLKMDINMADKYVIRNRVVRPVVAKHKRQQGEPYTNTRSGDRIINFTAHIEVPTHNILYSDPTSRDYRSCVSVRRSYNYSKSIKIREQLDEMFQFVMNITPLKLDERVSKIAKYKEDTIEKWGAPPYLKTIDDVDMSASGCGS